MLKALCCIAVLVSVSALPVVAQNQIAIRSLSDMGDMNGVNNPAMSASTPAAPVDPARAQFEAKAMQFENQNRQLALKRDTDRLLELATDLKHHVDSTGPNILSLDVVKRAQEIEKLAKSVKEKMKGE